MKEVLEKESLNYSLLPNKYKILKFINQGSYGKIYKGIDITNRTPIALKIAINPKPRKFLKLESQILKILKGGIGIPELKYYGEYQNYNVLIEPFLGNSLRNLFSENNNKFLLNDILLIAIQILNRLEFIHNKGIIHCDIKPDNFIPEKNIIYIIDFGLSTFYIINKKHIEFKESNKIIGTAKYGSVNSLQGFELSRRDDLESLAYMLIYFMRGNLPWENIKEKIKSEKYKKILKIKKNTVPLELCENIPNEFSLLLLYARSLEFEEKPDYDYCRELFSKLIKKNKNENDIFFSWNMNVKKNVIKDNKDNTRGFCCGVINLKIKNFKYQNSENKNYNNYICDGNISSLKNRYIKYFNSRLKNSNSKNLKNRNFSLNNDCLDNIEFKENIKNICKKNIFLKKKNYQKIKINLNKIKTTISTNKFPNLKKYFEKKESIEKTLTLNRKKNSENKNISRSKTIYGSKSKKKIRLKSSKKKDDLYANVTKKTINLKLVNYNLESIKPIFLQTFNLKNSNDSINVANNIKNNSLKKRLFNKNYYYYNFSTRKVPKFNSDSCRQKCVYKNFKKSHSLTFSSKFFKCINLFPNLKKLNTNNNACYKGMKYETKTSSTNFSIQSSTNSINYRVNSSQKKNKLQKKCKKEKIKTIKKNYYKTRLNEINKSNGTTDLNQKLNSNNKSLKKQTESKSNLTQIINLNIFDI